MGTINIQELLDNNGLGSLDVPPSIEEVPSQVEVESPIVEQKAININDILSRNGLSESSNITTKGSIANLNNILSRYDGKKLIKEDFLNDDALMDVVYSNLEARFKPASTVGTAYRGVTGLSGGTTGGTIAGPRDYRNMDREEAFEIWQNYHRSFAGGQTVTTANELTYSGFADDITKNKLGAGYMLFDSMDNAITGAGSYSEMGDAIWDYTKAGLHDPATVLTFGLGKIFGFAATKSAGAAARTLMIKGYQHYLKKGMTKTAARKAVGTALAKAAPVTAVDAMVNMGTDVAYQMQLIDTGAQEEYSGAQTAFAALGAMVVPAVYVSSAGVSGLRKSKYMENTWLAHKEFDKNLLTLGKGKALKLLKARVNKKTIIDSVDANFGPLNGDSKQFLNWSKAKAQAKKGIKLRGEKEIDIDLIDSFYRRFFLGDDANGKSGYWKALKDAGFVIHESMLEDNTVTGIWGQAVKDFMTDEAAERTIKKFEKSTGEKLNIAYTAEALGQNFISRVSTAGGILWTPSQLSRLEGMKMSPKEALEAFAKSDDKKKLKDPKRQEFALSIYKRLLTSHLSTTGANLKGFGQLVSINTAADFVTGAVNLSQSAFYKVTNGDVDKVIKYKNRAWGSVVGATRRGISVLSPDLEYKYAEMVLNASPKTVEKLFRDVSGDGGVNDSLKHFDLDPKNKVTSTIDAVTKGAQTVTLVRLQDQMTKTWAFGGNVNQAIMREYGELPEVFFQRKDVTLEMATDRFKDNVLDKAAFRTMRETASVNWSTLERQKSNFFRTMARGVENITNKSFLGYVVPFGSFFNTVVATAADLSGVNALRFAVKELVPGQSADFVTQEGSEALAKMITGWSGVALGVHGMKQVGFLGADERIKQGLAWNQERNNDGSIEDRTFDWPGSTIRLGSQIIAHGLDGSNVKDLVTEFNPDKVPTDLVVELGRQLGGQSVRDLKDFDRSVWTYFSNLYESITGGDKEGLNKTLDIGSKLLGPPASRISQGVTRPLDPVNNLVGLVTDSNMMPDLKQGSESFNQGTKYINNLFGKLGGVQDLDRRATPTRGFDQEIDTGKQLLGVRGSREPNMMEAMLNTAGMSSWRAISFDGPAEVKNYMEGLVAPILETTARKYLDKNPNFFESGSKGLDTKQRQALVTKIIAEAKQKTSQIMKTGELPRTLEMVRVLSSKNDKKVRKVMEYLDIKGDLSGILKDEDALSKLTRIKNLVDNYDAIFYGTLNLD